MDREDLNQAQRELDAVRTEEASRTTSAAKEYDPDGLKGTSLEHAPEMGQAFDQASAIETPSLERTEPKDQTQQGIGSQQVRDQAFTPELRPPPEIANPEDREKHTSEMQRDDEAARLANYESMADRIDQQQQGQQYDRGHDIG